MYPSNRRRVVIDKRKGLYYIKIDDIECRVSYRELMKHIATLPYNEDEISLDGLLTNKYYVLHVLLELCFLKTMGYKVGEQTYKRADVDDIWKAHLKALDVELQYAMENNDKEWVLKRLKELENLLEEALVSDEIREEMLLLISKWSYVKNQ